MPELDSERADLSPEESPSLPSLKQMVASVIWTEVLGGETPYTDCMDAFDAEDAASMAELPRSVMQLLPKTDEDVRQLETYLRGDKGPTPFRSFRHEYPDINIRDDTLDLFLWSAISTGRTYMQDSRDLGRVSKRKVLFKYIMSQLEQDLDRADTEMQGLNVHAHEHECPRGFARLVTLHNEKLGNGPRAKTWGQSVQDTLQRLATDHSRLHGPITTLCTWNKDSYVYIEWVDHMAFESRQGKGHRHGVEWYIEKGVWGEKWPTYAQLYESDASESAVLPDGTEKESGQAGQGDDAHPRPNAEEASVPESQAQVEDGELGSDASSVNEADNESVRL